MYSRRNLIWGALALIIAVEGIVLLLRPEAAHAPISIDTSTASSSPAQFANAGLAVESATASPLEAPPAEVVHSSTVVSASEPAPAPVKQKISTSPTITARPQLPVSSGQGVAVRIANPYDTAPQSFSAINDSTRAALVNILCTSAGAIRPISGSGVIIDSRGIILTNAHVAQYVLLAQSDAVNLSCTIRTGSPARAAWKAEVLYIPPVWVSQHISDFNAGQAVTGTGEHDYAFLLVSDTLDGTPLPKHFSYLPTDTREAIGFLGDEVIVAGYPAEFLGVAAEYSLYPLASATTIKQLLTFGSGAVDLISVGSVIEAQSGSSGGAITNPWGRLIGVITTTSAGATVDQRELRALSLSYVDRDLKTQAGVSLEGLLSGSVSDTAASFNATIAPTMLQQYLARLQTTQ